MVTRPSGVTPSGGGRMEGKRGRGRENKKKEGEEEWEGRGTVQKGEGEIEGLEECSFLSFWLCH